MARETCIIIVTGAPGTGKSYQSKKELIEYCKPNPKVGRTARKALIMDTNNEYSEFQTVHYDPDDKTDNGKNFKLLKNPEIRRVGAFKPNGRALTYADKNKAVVVIGNYRMGLVFLEDLNTYILGVHKSEELVSALCSARHKGNDLIIHVQNLSAIEPRMWQNVTFVRFHYQVGKVKNDGKTPNFELMRIVQYMVNYVYSQCPCQGDKCECGRKYFFVYVNTRRNKILLTEKTMPLYKEGVRMFKANTKHVSDELERDENFYVSLT